jgi:hypothetical protein
MIDTIFNNTIQKCRLSSAKALSNAVHSMHVAWNISNPFIAMWTLGVLPAWNKTKRMKRALLAELFLLIYNGKYTIKVIKHNNYRGTQVMHY